MRWPIHVQVGLLVRQQHHSLIPRRLGRVFLWPATSPPAPPGWWASAWISFGRWWLGRGSCSSSWMRARLRSGGCVRARLQSVGLCVRLHLGGSCNQSLPIVILLDRAHSHAAFLVLQVGLLLRHHSCPLSWRFRLPSPRPRRCRSCLRRALLSLRGFHLGLVPRLPLLGPPESELKVRHPPVFFVVTVFTTYPEGVTASSVPCRWRKG